ncbi:MAG: hypothetical protein M3400_05405 [Actinomycetota bacterium]|nr:hypothetical protein [Actinomycetota bacterium]
MARRIDREVGFAIKAAMTCARDQGATEIGGEHLLVGIAKVPCPAAALLVELGVDSRRLEDAVGRGAHDARLLAGLGIDLAAVQRQTGGRLHTRWRTRRPRFRVDVGKAIDQSRREMRALGTRRLRVEHVLLGLLDSSVAARELLLALDIDVNELRRRLVHALAQGG